MWISEQTAIISLHNINWLVFITEAECVYCAVRTGSLTIFHILDADFLGVSSVLKEMVKWFPKFHAYPAALRK